jgi:hypothetical protein
MSENTYDGACMTLGHGQWVKCIYDIISLSVYRVQITLALALAIFPPFGTFDEGVRGEKQKRI